METIDNASNNGTIWRFSCKVDAIGCIINNKTICYLFDRNNLAYLHCVWVSVVLACYYFARVETITRHLKINLLSPFCCCTSLRAGFQVYLSKRWVLICHQSSTIRFVVVFCWIYNTLFPDMLGER